MRRLLALLAVSMLMAATVAAEPVRNHRMQATAYCQSGTTASGVPVRRGVVAADPRVLPQGSVIRVQAPVPGYSGTYRVADTGAAVKGRVIDIYVPSCAAAKRFGRRSVRVRILELGPDAQLADRR